MAHIPGIGSLRSDGVGINKTEQCSVLLHPSHVAPLKLHPSLNASSGQSFHQIGRISPWIQYAPIFYCSALNARFIAQDCSALLHHLLLAAP